MRKLLVTSGPATGEELEIERELVIGRENADLVIEDHEMSRRHAVLRPVEQGVEIEDLGSTNGTYVDGLRITEPVTIAIRGAVKIGGSEFRVDVSLPQMTRLTEGAGLQATLASTGRPLAVTVGREVLAPAAPVPAEQPPLAPGEESRVESPHLPIPASIAIFAAALVAIVVVLVLAHY
jgi:hypothetical protein